LQIASSLGFWARPFLPPASICALLGFRAAPTFPPGMRLLVALSPSGPPARLAVLCFAHRFFSVRAARLVHVSERAVAVRADDRPAICQRHRVPDRQRDQDHPGRLVAGARAPHHRRPAVPDDHRIPLGLANFKLIPISLTPLGREIIDVDEARRRGTTDAVSVGAPRDEPLPQ
jgi:hypothetical protein